MNRSWSDRNNYTDIEASIFYLHLYKKEHGTNKVTLTQICKKNKIIVCSMVLSMVRSMVCSMVWGSFFSNQIHVHVSFAFDFHSDQVRIPLLSASKYSKSSWEGHLIDTIPQ